MIHSMPRLFCLLTFVTSLLPGSARADAPVPNLLTHHDAKIRSGLIRETSYQLRFQLDLAAPHYSGSVTVAFTLEHDCESDLRLDFKSTGLGTVTLDEQAVPPGLHNGEFLALPAGSLKTGHHQVQVEFENAYDSTGSGFHHFVDPVDQKEYMYSDFEPFDAHRMFPCFDQPDLKATYEVTVTGPATWQYVSNTPVASRQIQGDKVTVTFEQTPRLSTYLFFLGVGDYAVLEDATSDVPSRILLRQSLAPYFNPDDMFKTVRQGLTFYGDYFHFPYPFKKYDQIFVPEFPSGAMENPGAVTFNERYVFRTEPTTNQLHRRASTVLHEMAHMWFGDLVTMRWWDALWLNESFATYISAVAMDRATDYKYAFENFMIGWKGWAYWQDQLPTTHPVHGPVADTKTAWSNFDGITYGKGSALLKQLVFYVGEEAFRTGMKAYFEKNQWNNADLVDFLEPLSKSSKIDLTQWSAKHLQSSGVNTFLVHVDEENGIVKQARLQQGRGNGDKILRPQKLQIATYRKTKDDLIAKDQVIDITVTEEWTDLPSLAGKPRPDFIWPNFGDHAYGISFLDDRSYEFIRLGLGRIPDEMTRRGIWMSLGEMVRRARIAPAQFLETFCLELTRGLDPKIIELLDDSLYMTLELYLTKDYETWAGKIHSWAKERLLKSAPGSDDQKVAFELMVRTAQDEIAFVYFQSLLDKKVTIPSFELNQQRRWEILQQLARAGQSGVEETMSHELEKDPGDRWRKARRTALASMPVASSKESVWKEIVTESTLSLEDLKASMDGFHQFLFPDLSRPYVARFFAELHSNILDRDPWLANEFSERMFPKNVIDQAVVDQTSAFLKSHPDLPRDVMKNLENGADEISRTLRIRSTY